MMKVIILLMATIIPVPVKLASPEIKCDVIFLLDVSASIYTGDFKKVLQFLEDFLTHAHIDSGSIRVGVLTFGLEAQVKFQLNQYKTKRDIIDAIFDISHSYATYTNTHKGLWTMRNQMFTRANGDRESVPNVAIIITDGSSTYSNLTKQEADVAKENHIRIFVIGIGEGVDRSEIENIASSPRIKNSITIKDFNELKGLDEKIFSGICPEPPHIVHELSSDGIKATADETVQLRCHVTGNPRPTVQWYRLYGYPPNVRRELLGGKGEILTVPNLTREKDEGRYMCVASNGIPNDAHKEIGIFFLPPVVQLIPKRVDHYVTKDTPMGCTVKSVYATCRIQSSSYGKAFWKKGTDTISPTSADKKYILQRTPVDDNTFLLTLIILDIHQEDLGEYTCEASNSAGTVSQTMPLFEVSPTKNTVKVPKKQNAKKSIDATSPAKADGE